MVEALETSPSGAVSDTGNPGPSIPPVLVLSTGRCGSTMLSDILNRHPRILSLSEFFSSVGPEAFRFRRMTGDQMADLCSQQHSLLRNMLRGTWEELSYPFGAPGARYTRDDIPPILCTTLPHLTDRCDALFDELEPALREQPKQAPVDHFRGLFEWLCRRFSCDVWVERSGGSLLFGGQLMRRFPDARIIHIYRDGRDTAISMQGHYLFQRLVAIIHMLQSRGINVFTAVAGSRYWDHMSVWMRPLADRFMNLNQLPYDEAVLADFGTLWSSLVERGHKLLGELPEDRLLNIRFETMQAEPDSQIRRLIRFIDPDLEDEAWLREVAAIPRATPSKFARLEESEQAALLAACRPGLERLGYSY